MQILKEGVSDTNQFIDSNTAIMFKMRAFQELEEMLVPVTVELNYDKKLAEVSEKSTLLLFDGSTTGDSLTIGQF